MERNGRAAVEIAELAKRFGSATVLHPTDLAIEAGEFIVSVGPSGCGKSTLLRLIAGLEEPSAGRIAIDGRRDQCRPRRPRARHGVPVLCALPAPFRRREHRLSAQDRAPPQGRDRRARGGGGGAAGPHRAPVAPPARFVGRSAAARVDRPRDHPRAVRAAVPFAATTKMDGCAAIYPAVAALFVAQYYGVPLHAGDYLLVVLVSVLGSAATAGLTGALVMLTLTLSTLGLPLEGAGLLLAIDPILDMGRTAVNVAGQILVLMLVARETGALAPQAEPLPEGAPVPAH